MPLDAEAISDMVLQAVELACGPLLERLAAAETLIKGLVDVRDRVVAIEVKSAVPVTDPAVIEVRDRLLTLETKGATPTAAELLLADVKERLIVLEQRAPLVLPPVVSSDELASVRDRLTAIETKSAIPPTAEPLLADAKAAIDAVRDQVGDLRERVAVVETRQPIPGPPGKDGANGANGKDGADGIGFDEIVAIQVGEREVTLKGTKGDRTKDLGTIVIPAEIYRGVFDEGKPYQRGDCVTWAGSEWHCNEPTTTKPGEGLKAWTLKVKRGRDGKDGKDAPGAIPVVKVGG